MSEDRQLEVRYQGRIIEHLTVQTYQSPVAAIAEVVANAWDADANNVAISLPQALNKAAPLMVADDGNGMTFEQCQDRYLAVGYQRRGDDPTSTSDGKRPLMGRKGIGKFAGFGIANVMVVDTVSRETGERTVFRLEYDRLRGESEEYVEAEATQVPDVKWYAKGDHDKTPGTTITLQQLKLRQRPSPDVMRRSLARRFLLLERADDFAVTVDAKPIADEGDDSGVQFTFPSDWSKNERPESLTVDDDGWGKETVGGHEVRWKVLFYNDTIKDEELRGVSVFAHGKLAQRPFFFDIGERGGISAQQGQQYLSGKVEASFLDEGDEDLISIERQRVDWEHPLAAPLLTWGQDLVRGLLSDWGKKRVEAKVQKLNQKVARFSPRLEKLPPRERKIVEGAIKNFAEVRALTEDQFVTLSEGTLTAWEGGRLRELINDVAETDKMSEADLLNVLMEHQVLTALHTAEAVKAKRTVVIGLRDRIRKKDLENAVRDYIAENPWLIDPRWETFKVEKSLKKLVDETANHRFSADMLDKRLDLVLASGEQLLVLEFMRPGLTVNGDHLSRFSLYINAIRANVGANTATAFTNVNGYIVADRLEKDIALKEEIEQLARQGKYAIEWEALLEKAANHWGDFFEALVERSPDDPRIKDLKALPGGDDAKELTAGEAEDGNADAASAGGVAQEAPTGADTQVA
jgi:hypothetical protein